MPAPLLAALGRPVMDFDVFELGVPARDGVAEQAASCAEGHASSLVVEEERQKAAVGAAAVSAPGSARRGRRRPPEQLSPQGSHSDGAAGAPDSGATCRTRWSGNGGAAGDGQVDPHSDSCEVTATQQSEEDPLPGHAAALPAARGRLSVDSTDSAETAKPDLVVLQRRDDTAAAAVKRLLGPTLEQLVALITEAKALNMVEEVQAVEKELLPLFLTRGPVAAPSRRDAREALASQRSADASSAPRSRALSRSSSCGPTALREAPAPRSGALSRASSCESFFDEPGGRQAEQAARFVLGEATQPSTPRSLIHTPGGARVQWDGRQWPEGEVLDATGAEIAALLPLPPPVAPALPMVSWHEPMVEVAATAEPPRQWLEQSAGVALGFGARCRDDERPAPIRQPPRLERRPIHHAVGPLPGVGFMWHTSPFCISRTPNVHTPVSHCSPARSPTSFSGYCSPINPLPSGVASPNQRRSQSGYSSPSADRAHFFVGTATAQSGLMSRLMSLREARGEEKEEDGEWSSTDAPEAAEGAETDLLECLLQHAERVPLSKSSRDPPYLCLDLSAELLAYSRRGLAPNPRAPYLNSFLQALLPCAPLMHLFAQLSRHALNKQRLAYACLVQITFQFFGAQGEGLHSSQVAFSPFDACAYAEPLLRRFERGKPASNSGPSWPGPTEMLARFVRFVLGQLHDECKWPTLSPIVGHYEDSPVTRIFGGLLRTGRGPPWTARADAAGSLVDPDHSDIEPFLVLHLDAASEPKPSVAAALQHLMRPERASFLRLPPCLFIHLQRFRMVDGVPTKVSRHCHIDLRLELEEAANCVLRAVSYELCSAVCHYGELPEGGAYKTLARYGSSRAAAAGAAPGVAGGSGAAQGPAGGCGTSGGTAGASEWHLFDDAAVRAKSAEELGAVVQCEGYHVCFLLYKREDTKTINMRPHAL